MLYLRAAIAALLISACCAAHAGKGKPIGVPPKEPIQRCNFGPNNQIPSCSKPCKDSGGLWITAEIFMDNSGYGTCHYGWWEE